MSAPFPILFDGRTYQAFAFLGAGSHDLTAITGKPQRCARRVVALVAGNWTALVDSSGVDSPAGAVPEGYVHDAHTSAITCSAAVAIYW